MNARTPIRDKFVRARQCVICREAYTPRYVEQQTCGGRCSRIFGGQHNRGRFPAGFAVAASRRREAKDRAIQATCQERWGDLSAREIEIFEFAVRTGYDRGYNKGLQSQRRQKATAA